MSLQSVSGLSNEIETVVDADRNIWLRWAHVGTFLSIKHIDTSMERLDRREMPTSNDIKPKRHDIKVARRGYQSNFPCDSTGMKHLVRGLVQRATKQNKSILACVVLIL